MGARRSPRTIYGFHLRTFAIFSAVVILTVTALVAATGDNVADAVLGQIDFSHNGINNSAAASLNSPSQMAVDLNSSPQHLYVVDGANNRILGWNDAATFTNGQNADIEIGQPDFRTTLCNSGTVMGDVAGLGADSLCEPSSVAVDGNSNLYIADLGNNRVLEYSSPFAQAISTGFSANLVFGQGGSFTQTVCAQTASGVFSAGRRLRLEQQSLRSRRRQPSRARVQSAARRAQHDDRRRRHGGGPGLRARRQRQRFPEP